VRDRRVSTPFSKFLLMCSQTSSVQNFEALKIFLGCSGLSLKREILEFDRYGDRFVGERKLRDD
jgi:hypothetical protein